MFGVTGSHGVVQDSLELLEPSNPPASAFQIAKTLSPCYCAEPPLPSMSFLIVPVHAALATCIVLPLWMSSSVILLGVSVSQERIESRRWKQLVQVHEGTAVHLLDGFLMDSLERSSF